MLAVLEDVRGDLQLAIDRISEGNISTWGQVTGKHSSKKGALATGAPGGGGKSSQHEGGRKGKGFVVVACM